MANQLTVLVVFAAVAQVSLAATHKSETDSAWHNASQVVFDALLNPSVNLQFAKNRYLTSGTNGLQAFLAVTRGQGKGKGQSDLQVAANSRYQTIADTVFNGITKARSAARASSKSVSSDLDKLMNGIPVTSGVDYYYKLAGSGTSPKQALTYLKTVYTSYFGAMKALATNNAQKIPAYKSAADFAITLFINEIYYAALAQGG